MISSDLFSLTKGKREKTEYQSKHVTSIVVFSGLVSGKNMAKEAQSDDVFITCRQHPIPSLGKSFSQKLVQPSHLLAAVVCAAALLRISPDMSMSSSFFLPFLHLYD